MTKILVITYYWPPAGGPGVQRWLNFVRFLPEFDVEPVLFIPSNPYYPIKDETLLAEIPPNLKCYRQKTREPFFWSKLMLGSKTKRISSGIIKEHDSSLGERLALWIRGNFFIPDARKAWVKPAIRKIVNIIENESISAIISTGPPHSTHLIGLGVKQRAKIHWIADFRDPWTNIGYHKKLRLTGYSQKKHKKLEKQVLQSADKIITTSRTTAEEFEKITGKAATVITNGYVGLNQEDQANRDQEFSLSFIGSMLSGRNPDKFWKVLSQLVQENPDFKNKLHLKLIGVISQDVRNSLEKHNLSEFTSVIPYVSHEDALKYQRRSQVLLLIEKDSPETRGIIPGKLFEYMAARRPILAIGPENWESGNLVLETKSGAYFDYSAETQMKSQLLEWFGQFQKEDLEISPVNIERFSRRALTEKLATELVWE